MLEVDNLYRSKIKTRLTESAEVKMQTAKNCVTDILSASMLLADSFESGGKLLLCGNGGSAADCQHMATELVSRLNKNFIRPPLPAIALTTDTSFLTAFANDSGYEGIFERQVQALGNPEDVLIAISTSGNSPNIIRAIEKAQAINMKTIALTGVKGRLKELSVDVLVSVPSTNTQYIQEAHLAIEHIICELVEDYLYSKETEKKI